MFFGFKPKYLKKTKAVGRPCHICEGDILTGEYMLIQSFFKSKDIEDFRYLWCKSFVNTFSEAIVELIGERREEFFLTINGVSFLQTQLDTVGYCLMCHFFDKESRLDLSDPRIEIRVHFIK